MHLNSENYCQSLHKIDLFLVTKVMSENKNIQVMSEKKNIHHYLSPTGVNCTAHKQRVPLLSFVKFLVHEKLIIPSLNLNVICKTWIMRLQLNRFDYL
jgi:hypothetical protein